MVQKRDIFQIYRKESRLVRFYIHIKLKICPFLRLESFFPSRGKIVDLGCGNGLFANILSLGSPEREIWGFDLDEKKIRIAQKTQGKGRKTRFEPGNIVNMDYPSADIFSLIDVLYLIPYHWQEKIIRKCYLSLPQGGILFIKEMDTLPKWKYFWNFIQETLAVKIVGFTLGEKFYFRSREDFRRILAQRGFQVTTIPLDKGYAYPHIAYICVK